MLFYPPRAEGRALFGTLLWMAYPRTNIKTKPTSRDQTQINEKESKQIIKISLREGSNYLYAVLTFPQRQSFWDVFACRLSCGTQTTWDAVQELGVGPQARYVELPQPEKNMQSMSEYLYLKDREGDLGPNLGPWNEAYHALGIGRKSIKNLFTFNLKTILKKKMSFNCQLSLSIPNRWRVWRKF